MDNVSLAQAARFLNDEAAAQEALHNLRWPNGVQCPFCEGGKKVYEVAYKHVDARTGEIKATARKQWKCGACRKKFSVTSRSIFEGSHIRVGQWIYAIFRMCSGKKGVSANELAREMDITVKSAWFLCHRVREAMLQEPLAGMLGTGPDAVVELDETFMGGKKKNNRHANRTASAGRKTAVMTLIDREGDVKIVKVPNVPRAPRRTLQSQLWISLRPSLRMLICRMRALRITFTVTLPWTTARPLCGALSRTRTSRRATTAS